MNDEAESSAAGLRHVNTSASDAHLEPQDSIVEDTEEDARAYEQRVKDRRVDAKRKRVVFLDHLLRELDGLVWLELITTYHLEFVLIRPRPVLEVKTNETAVAHSFGSSCAS